MDSKQGLYYALGHIAYALASADGEIQKEEKQELHEIVSKGIKGLDPDMDYSEIVFSLLQKDHIPLHTAYEWGMREMKLNSHYLSEKMKQDFINILVAVAAAFPPITIDEEDLLMRFRTDIARIKGDPVFTGE